MKRGGNRHARRKDAAKARRDPLRRYVPAPGLSSWVGLGTGNPAIDMRYHESLERRTHPNHV